MIFINILNGKPILKNVLTHLYKLRKIYYGNYKNSGHIGLHVPNRDFTSVYNKGFLVRSYSTLSLTNVSNRDSLADSYDIKMKNFYEWFCGFVDAEGSFYIAINKICSFRFQINLHKNDINVLYYIQNSLGFGEARFYKNYASFTVTRLKDMTQLLNIFDNYPLQGSKWLGTFFFNYYHSSFKYYYNCKALYIFLMKNVHYLFISIDLIVYNLFISQLLFTKAKPSTFKGRNLFTPKGGTSLFRRYYSKKRYFFYFIWQI